MHILPTIAFRSAVALAALSLIPFLAACGDDVDNGDGTPTASATSPTPELTTGNAGLEDTPTPEPALEPTPLPSPAYDIATGPQHFLYVVRDGDTLATIASYFDAAVGEGGFVDPAEIGDLNDVDDADLEPDMLLAVPLRLPAVEAIMPENTIEEALGVGDDDPIILLQPTREMLDGFLGVIALYRITLVPAGGEDGAGYVMEYWFTDRPGIRAGEIDPDAVFSEPAFTITGGSLAEADVPDAVDSHAFERNTVPYTFYTYPATDLEPADLVGMLGTVAERLQ